MASTTNVPLIERADVHKSCKAMETVMAALQAYTETATSLANVQKKLAKALKEAAAVKGTNATPANALASGAVVFEVLSEIDIKFSKIIDKEAENIGSEVKKWFKKLAKEEKVHDERMATANAKIRQAGQAYEKMAKRKDRDVTEEHSRYVAVLNSLGPEMQQDKHNHALLVTQRHTAALSEFSAALARLAEAEWFRACEQVRKFAPSIGNLGEWRVLCEGKWSGHLPDDLPDIDKVNIDNERKLQQHTEQIAPQRPSPNASEYAESSTNSNTSRLPYLSQSPADVRDVHLPSPSSTTAQETPRQSARKKSLLVEGGSDVASISSDKPGSSAEPILIKEQINEAGPSYHPQQRTKLEVEDIKTAVNLPSVTEEPTPFSRNVPLDNSEKDNTIKPNSNPNVSAVEIEERRESIKPLERAKSPEKERFDPPTGMSSVDRHITGEVANRRNSLVATMRERYDPRPDLPPPKPPSPTPRDIPRSFPKVTDVATRYAQVESSPSSPRGASSNSPVQSNITSSSTDNKFTTFQERRNNRTPVLQSSGEGGRTPQRDYFDERDEHPRYLAATTPVRGGQPHSRGDWEDYGSSYRRKEPFQEHGYSPHGYDEMGTRRRIDPLDEQLSTLEEREAQLREQARHIERERVRLTEEKERERQFEKERPRNDRENGYTSDTNTSPSAYGRRMYTASPQPVSVDSEVSLLRPIAIPADHAPNCGCERCSVQHYRGASRGALSSPNLASDPSREGPVLFKPEPPIQLRPEKPKGWFRRMSMPVANIVGGDKDKKFQSPTSVGVNSNRAHMGVPEEDDRVRRRSFERRDESIGPGMAGLGAGGGAGRYAYSGATMGRR